MWVPQPGPQLAAMDAAWCDELFFGGARGGGKSDFQIGYQEDGALRYGAAHRGIMFRKTYPELEELQVRAMEVFPAEGAQYKKQSSSEYPFRDCWYWRSGATVKMRYLEREQDYSRYHGHQYSQISFDEITEYPTLDGMTKMLSTLRSPHGIPCTVRLTGNPGGVGHAAVKRRYIDPAPPFSTYTDPEIGMIRMYIPSVMEDNALLMQQNPRYRSAILAATEGNAALRQAWLSGNWDLVAGAFFAEWDRSRHVIEPTALPSHWMRFRGFDWGSSAPFSVGWYAVSDGELSRFPRGALIRYREWYGAKAPNVGLKMTAEAVAHGIRERDGADHIAYGVADPKIFSHDGGPSIMESMLKSGITWRRGDNTRVAKAGPVNGWDQVRARLQGIDYGTPAWKPMLYIFSTCTDLVRTLPMQQHDPHRLEDIDTRGEDHAADELRYACASRPWVVEAEKPKSPVFRMPTFSELLEDQNRRNG